jgi:hypothetical protein
MHMTLQRYNQIAIAIISTVAIIGVSALVCFAAFQGLSNHEPQGVAVRHTDKPKPKQNLVLCAPARVAGSAFQYVPVAMVVQRDADDTPYLSSPSRTVEADYQPRFGDCQLESYRAYGRIFNAVVRNVKTGEDRLLLSQPSQIDRLVLPRESCAKGEGTLPCNVLLWMIRPRDSNNDGLINGKDAIVAYLSDLSASNLQQVTPSESTVLENIWSPEDHSMIFQIRKDTNGDKQFTDEDGSDLIRVDFEKLTMGVALLSETTRKKLEEALR